MIGGTQPAHISQDLAQVVRGGRGNNGLIDEAVTVRERIQLYRSPRRRPCGRIIGYEVMFLCPTCSSRAKRLVLLSGGPGCAKCFDIKWGSERESCALGARGMMPTNTTNMKTFAAAADGLKLAYYVDDFTDPWRTPDTLVLLHAAMASALRWFDWVPRLARRYRVVRLDLRGHGNSVVRSHQEG